MEFLKNFKKELATVKGVTTTSLPPRYWYSTGNLVLNYILSGYFDRGIPQGRITNFCGPSGAGKSFNVANAVAEAQRKGAIILVIDSENALDDEFMTKIGVDVDHPGYTYVSAITIAQIYEIIPAFLKAYKAQYGEDEDAPQVMIVIDSLDMLMTDTELENLNKGIQKGDQGQKNKQLKAMLRGFVQEIKHLNVSMVVTSQVYKNQDLLNGEGLWIVPDAVKYSASIIALIQKRKLKADSGLAGDFKGVRMIVEGYKSRFTKPFQKVEIEVPYEEGMDPYSGLKDVAVAAGVLIKKGSRLSVAGDEKTFFERDIGEYVPRIIAKLNEMKDSLVLDTDAEIDRSDEGSSKQRRQEKFESQSEE